MRPPVFDRSGPGGASNGAGAPAGSFYSVTGHCNRPRATAHALYLCSGGPALAPGDPSGF